MVAHFLTKLVSLLPDIAPKVVLEVGAGEGHVSALLRERSPESMIVAFDLPDPELTVGWADLRGVFGSAERLPFRDRSVDLVLAIEVLEHVDDPARALAEIARVAKGPVLASVPREPLWRVLNVARGKYVRDGGNTPGHVQHWGRAAFVKLVAEHLEVRQVVSALPWTVVAANRRA
jgi:ubiquinone/menaquinone biosynthesis C-methylase UbiE